CPKKTVRSTGTATSSDGVFFSLSLLFVLVRRPSRLLFLPAAPYSCHCTPPSSTLPQRARARPTVSLSVQRRDCTRRISLHPSSAASPTLLPLNGPSLSPYPFNIPFAHSLTLPPRSKSSRGACTFPRSPCTESSRRCGETLAFGASSRLSIFQSVSFPSTSSSPFHVFRALLRCVSAHPASWPSCSSVPSASSPSLLFLHSRRAASSLRVVAPIAPSTHPRPSVLARSSSSPNPPCPHPYPPLLHATSDVRVANKCSPPHPSFVFPPPCRVLAPYPVRRFITPSRPF
ncbi:hypothetical protein B0H17DRAFT_1337835, partial [Mycena rosella]